MNTQLKASLERKIIQWATENCEADEWPADAYFGDQTTVLMVRAAACVFDAVVESQDYTRREGLLTET